jgi:hypothetical protein
MEIFRKGEVRVILADAGKKRGVYGSWVMDPLVEKILDAYQFHRICQDEIWADYVYQEWDKKGYQHALFALDADDFIVGFLLFSTVDKKDATSADKPRNIYAKLPTIDISRWFDSVTRVAFVHVLCSLVPGSGIGRMLLDLVEGPHPALVKAIRESYQAVVLESIIPAYQFYARRGYIRTMDFRRMLPIYLPKKPDEKFLRVDTYVHTAARPKNHDITDYTHEEQNGQTYKMAKLVGGAQAGLVASIERMQKFAPAIPRHLLKRPQKNNVNT